MGGGVMRSAAAKVAGVGVFNGGFRRAARPQTPNMVSGTAEEVKCGALVSSSQGATMEQSVQRACWAVDDWKFPEDEFVVDKVDADAQPRVLFGPVPSLDEAKKATSELQDALEIMCYSPKHSWSENSTPGSHDTRSCIINETADVPSIPNSAMHAFTLLKQSASAQTVVASIASDPKVWDAVMQNPMLVEYLQTEKTRDVVEEHEPKSPESSIGSSDSKNSDKPGNFMDFMDNVKHYVVEMVHGLSEFFQNFFVGPSSENESKNGDLTKYVGGGFMAVAIMVMIMVVLRRG